MRAQLIFKTILIATAVFCINFLGVAQNGNKQNKQQTNVDKAKIGYLTEGLDLETKEAEKFWPVHNKFQKRLKDNYDKKQKDDADADEKMRLEEETLKIKKDKLEELKKVLPKDKVSKYYKLEKDFKSELLKKLRKDKN